MPKQSVSTLRLVACLVAASLLLGGCAAFSPDDSPLSSPIHAADLGIDMDCRDQGRLTAGDKNYVYAAGKLGIYQIGRGTASGDLILPLSSRAQHLIRYQKYLYYLQDGALFALDLQTLAVHPLGIEARDASLLKDALYITAPDGSARLLYRLQDPLAPALEEQVPADEEANYPHFYTGILSGSAGVAYREWVDEKEPLSLKVSLLSPETGELSAPVTLPGGQSGTHLVTPNGVYYTDNGIYQAPFGGGRMHLTVSHSTFPLFITCDSQWVYYIDGANSEKRVYRLRWETVEEIPRLRGIDSFEIIYNWVYYYDESSDLLCRFYMGQSESALQVETEF
ncbi:hypothetical protein [Bittarella massiliensis (ex Durand et al. 2017)]|uniref:hypothetical protein n=1 Tax=Bittarella massiliensis (ex Durand et al. 2017) TaxID=1720313 RepID=UPI001AA15B27|nr:hypothetical protein [Bittarella massiliensis (ex Durand et al. 2017)]MBO1678362.1 hypothetical protein [Bittarella massiliensis (ex Durand et al. 2017)]